MLKVDKKKLLPYGDRLDDGVVQLSFTLPIAASPEAREAAKQCAQKLGLVDVSVCAMESMGEGFSYFVVYGRTRHAVDVTKIKVPKVDVTAMKYEELRGYMSRNLEKPIVVVGACTGDDAHTVGIDAIMNMKGYDHDFGLERYPLFTAHNLRSQLSNAELIGKAVELGADAMLISQVVTQRGSHIKNLKEFRKLMGKDGRLGKDVIVVIGGPRIDHALALKLGFDAGFGPGTRPSQVASFIVHEYMKRHRIKERSLAEDYETKEGAPQDVSHKLVGGQRAQGTKARAKKSSRGRGRARRSKRGRSGRRRRG